ncbi:MAG: hypothetical protein IH807_00295 [Proteobacteria bacterium]|nr:hypothetical protein [Pseudomonadota bacterium]
MRTSRREEGEDDEKLPGPIFALAVGALAGAANAPAVQADADSFTYTTDDGNGGAERASAAARGLVTERGGSAARVRPIG